jgi:hypothetical protein
MVTAKRSEESGGANTAAWSDNSGMSENAHHLLIPFASVSSDAAAKYLQDLNLPNLRQLLGTLSLVDSDVGTDESFSPPHERALARVQGLPVVDGYIPWAAQEAAQLGFKNADSAVWGWVSLCSNVVGTGSLTLEDPALLQVTEIESRQLFNDMQPYFAEDGLTLHHVAPNQWLVSGEPLRDVRTASLDRVIGKDLADWQPAQGASASLRRLQNEMQMLLYTHPVNDARSRARAAAINSIWLHGTGELAIAGGQVSTNITTAVHVPRTLVDAAFKEDWPTWVKAWQQLDATLCADLLKLAQAGEPVTLTLCGERSALRYELRSKSAMERIKASFRGILTLHPAYLLPKQL